MENQPSIDIIVIVILTLLIFVLAAIVFYLIWSFINKKREEKNIFLIKTKLSLSIFSEQLIEALTFFKLKKVGALIVFQGKKNVKNYLTSEGIFVDAIFSPDLLKNIFLYKKTQLHDGALIIDHNFRIQRISAYIGVASNQKTLKNVGSRHNAAYSLVLQSDALVLVVSEVTGHLTLFINKNSIVKQAKMVELKSVLKKWYYG